MGNVDMRLMWPLGVSHKSNQKKVNVKYAH